MRSAARRLAMLTVAGLAVGAIWGAPSSNASVATPAAATGSSGATVRDDATASSLARSTQSKVLVDTRTSGTTQVFANPDGTFTAEIAVDPVRVRRGVSWVPVDSSLRANGDGTLSPTASATDMRFSGGGSSPLIRVTRGGVTLDVSWPSPLPAPTVVGDTATYSDVYPGVDLEVTAAGASVTHRLVVKTRAAASDPRVRTITYGQRVTGGTKVKKANGSGFVITDGVGEAVFESPEALMWDSGANTGATAATTTTQLTKSSARTPSSVMSATGTADAGADVSANEPREGDKVADLPTQIGTDTLTVSPSTALLDSPTTVFPVSIDPQTAPLISNWAMVDAAYPSVSYYHYGGDQGVGYQDFSAWSRKRLFYGFTTSGLNTTQVTVATLSAYEVYSATCSAGTVDAYMTSDVSSGTNWSNQPSRFSAILDSFSTKAGRSDCLPGGALGSWDVTAAVQNRVANKSTLTTIQLAGRSETTTSSWMRIAGPAYTTTSRRPILSVTYNNPPAATPTYYMKAPTDQTDCATSATGAPRINGTSSSAYMYARAYDAQGGSLTTAFRVYDSAGTNKGTYYAPPYASSAGTWTPYQKAPITSFSGLSNGATYSWAVVTKDSTSGYVNWSAKCYFVMDTAAPAGAPMMTSTPDNDQLLPATQGLVPVKLYHPEAASFAYSVAEVSKGTVPATSGYATINADVSKNVVRVGAQARDSAGNVGTGGSLWLNKAVARRMAVYHFSAPTLNQATRGAAGDAELTGDWTLPIDAATDVGEGRYASCATDPTSTSCVNDKALEFAPGAPAVALEHRPVRTDDSLTVGAWVYVNENNGASTIVQQNGTAGALQLYFDGNADSPVDADGDGSPDSDGRFAFAVGSGTTRVIAYDALPAGSPGARVGGWTYVAGTYDKTASSGSPNGRIWITTVRRASAFSAAVQLGGPKVNVGAALTQSTGTFYIGGSGVNATGDPLSPFLGRVDELSVWQAAYDPNPPSGQTIAYNVRDAASEASQ